MQQNKPVESASHPLESSGANPSDKGFSLRIRDPFGNIIFLKRLLTSVLGIATYPGLNLINRTHVEGAEHLKKLPGENVLIISNHQTYFADVFALYHIFSAAKWGFRNINLPLYLLSPRVRSYYIAAEETMLESGWLPRLFTYAGAVTIKRNWRHAGQNVNRGADLKAPAKIIKALKFGWVITFPQGTTAANAPVRKGTAHIIQLLDPIVVPIDIDGFNQAFDKKGLRLRKKGTKLTVKIGTPIRFGKEKTVDEIQDFLEAHLLNKPD
jgi:1-acyl-sn-glycerol-3-phosphate acyltransferase